MSRPRESPTMRTRNGVAAVGVLRVRRRGRGRGRGLRRPWCAGARVGCGGVWALGPRREPDVPPGQPVRAAGDRDDVRELQPAAERGDRPDHVEADGAAGADRATPARCAAVSARTAGTTPRRRPAPRAEHTGPRQAHPAVLGRRQLGVRARAELRVGLPVARGAVVSAGRSSEAVVDEWRHADRAEGGDGEQGEAEQADLDHGALARERRLQAVDAGVVGTNWSARVPSDDEDQQRSDQRRGLRPSR